MSEPSDPRCRTRCVGLTTDSGLMLLGRIGFGFDTEENQVAHIRIAG